MSASDTAPNDLRVVFTRPFMERSTGEWSELDQVDEGKYWSNRLLLKSVMRRGQVLDAAKVDGWHLKGVDAIGRPRRWRRRRRRCTGGISREGGGGSDYVNQTHQGSKRPSQGPTNMAGIKGKWAPAIEGRRLTG
jgi:hypothetical protein